MDIRDRQSLIYEIKEAQYKAFENLDKVIMDRCSLDVYIYSIVFGSHTNMDFDFLLRFFDKDTTFLFFFVNNKNKDWIYNDKERQPFELEEEYNGTIRDNLDVQYRELFIIMQEQGFDVRVWEYSEEI